MFLIATSFLLDFIISLLFNFSLPAFAFFMSQDFPTPPKICKACLDIAHDECWVFGTGIQDVIYSSDVESTVL
jgi:hypothetical protein